MVFMASERRTWAIMLHGGAGRFDIADQAACLDVCRTALEAGRFILAHGGCALDAVQAAVMCLEDDPLFNAGTGSVLNRDGQVEMDAAIMDGASLRAGAVAALRQVKNPILVARHILEDGRHVMLAGDGAKKFAQQCGVPLCEEAELLSPRQAARWRERYGTVGAVAFDAVGGLAAATSTGGTFGKLPGRIGDSAVIGCGTYADEHAAVSCTGMGEAIIRLVLARRVAESIAAGRDPESAARDAVAQLEMQANGGLIVADRFGRLAFAYTTPQMPVCYLDSTQAEPRVSI